MNFVSPACADNLDLRFSCQTAFGMLHLRMQHKIGGDGVIVMHMYLKVATVHPESHQPKTANEQ